MALVVAEHVRHRTERRRFTELPWVLHRNEPRWAPPLAAYEHWRLDRHRNPCFRDGTAELFLVRRAGRVVGRISAHRQADDDPAGWFGFFDVADDPDATRVLVDTAKDWLAGQGRISITGPASFTPRAEAGVLVSGFEVAGVTGRPWQPQWYAEQLVQTGLRPVAGPDGERRHWRLDPAEVAQGVETAAPVAPASTRGRRHALPTLTGAYGDPRLLLAGEAGTVVAVPDISGDVRSPWRLARRARRREWEGCTVVLVDGEPDALVPALCRVAAEAGYRWVLGPWAPDDRPPETIHQLFTGSVT